MLTNYYTLRLIARDFDRRFSGCAMAEAFSQRRNELVLRLVSSSVENPERVESEFLVVRCEPNENAIFAREEFHRVRLNSVDVLNRAMGRVVDRATMHPSDREIQILFSDGWRLIVQMFGPSANVLLADEHQHTVDAFLHKKEIVGSIFVSAPMRAFVLSLERWKALVKLQPTFPLRQAAKEFAPQFGRVLANEAIYRAALHELAPIAELTEAEQARFVQVLQQIESELTSAPEPRIYYRGDSPVQFSIIHLRHCGELREDLMPSIHAGIRTFIAASKRSDRFLAERTDIERAVEKESERLRRTLKHIAEDAVKREAPERLELFGKLLTANLHHLAKGMTKVLLEDVISGTTEVIEIKLDPHLSPAKNAARYFDKARKSREASAESAVRADETRRLLNKLEPLRDQVASLNLPEELARFRAENRELLSSLGLTRPNDKRQLPPFRIFTVAGGFHVWCGKSSENNDLLSTRHTAKNDLWFHARSVGGSHVVLKVGTGKGEPSKLAITQAASIAAYYSKMKNASTVPVAMCEGKYVRKSKGAPAGTVTLERETVLFVEPALPQPSGNSSKLE